MDSARLQKMFMTLILLVIALALTGTVADAAYHASHYAGISGTASATLIDLVPLFWVVAILGIAVASIYYYFK